MGARLAHQPLLQTVFEPITDLPVLEQHLPVKRLKVVNFEQTSP